MDTLGSLPGSQAQLGSIFFEGEPVQRMQQYLRKNPGIN